MALTLQDVMDMARLDLNDDDAVDADRRYPDTELIKHCNTALLLILEKRPEALLGSYSDASKVPNGERIASDPFPFDARYLKPTSDVVVSFAQTKDEEMAQSGKVRALFERAFSMVG